MSDTVGALPLRGKTLLSGAGRTLDGTENAALGKEQDFKDYGPRSYGTNSVRSQRTVTCMLVRNASGIALLPKRIVKWKAGSEGKEIGGYCAVDHERVAGIVDECLPAAGVPANDLFWITIRGPSLVITSSVGDDFNVWAAGQIVTALTAAASTNTTAGRPQPFAATTNVTNAVSIAFNRIGRAMSAKTTANTNADLLVDVNIMV